MTTLGPQEQDRLLKYAHALGVCVDDLAAMASWKPLIENVMREADKEVVQTLAEHATAHNHHLELTRRENERLNESAKKAVLDHNCSFFRAEEVEHREEKDSPTAQS